MATAKKSTTGKKRMTKKEREKRKRNKILLIIAEVAVLLIMAGVLWFVTMADKLEGTELKEDDITVNDGLNDGLNSNDGVNKNMNYRTIALFGVDSRYGELGKGTLSDTILIASINQQTKEVKLVSIFRDTYLNLGNDSYGKANGAYSKGGPKQAINMLNMNLDLYITDYVTVGFKGLVNTIDALGGVEIEVDESEISHLNNYQIGTAEALGVKNITKVTSTGYQTLSGLQAASYCRIRYTAGDDFKRAERQREVIQAIADKAKKADVATLNKIASSTFEQVSTSLTLNDILDLTKDVGDYTIGENTGFPFEEYRATGKVKRQSIVMPVDLTKNVTELHKFLYGEEGYDPTQSVKEYSARISQDTGK